MPSQPGQKWAPFARYASQIFVGSETRITSCIVPDPDIFTFDNAAGRATSRRYRGKVLVRKTWFFLMTLLAILSSKAFIHTKPTSSCTVQILKLKRQHEFIKPDAVRLTEENQNLQNRIASLQEENARLADVEVENVQLQQELMRFKHYPGAGGGSTTSASGATAGNYTSNNAANSSSTTYTTYHTTPSVAYNSITGGGGSVYLSAGPRG